MRLLSVLLMILLATPAWAFPPLIAGKTASAAAGPAYISSSGATNSANSDTLTLAFGTSTTTGDLLVVGLACGGQDCPTVGANFSDDRGNTWTRDYVNTGVDNAIYSAIAKDAGTVTVTAVVAASTIFFRGVVAAFRNVASNTPDAAGVGAQASSTDLHHGNLVTSAAGVIFGLARMNSGASTMSEDVNWTLIAENEANNTTISGCYRITTAGGTYNDGWTAGTTGWWGASAVGYK